tara:strand:- start:170 stop:607 length:438 start_codon:yes stop_codon:yes gene_type:complete
MPMGNGVYMVGVSGNGNGRFKSLGKLRDIAFGKAEEYAAKNNAEIEVISVNETPMSFGVFNQVDLSFRLVKKSEKLADPNVNSTTTIKAASANGKTTSKQVIKAKDNSKKDEEKYERLLKLGELRDKGILSEEEFQIEKNKILNE